MNKMLESKKVKAVLWIFGGLAVLFVIFGFGIAVGYHKAMYASHWRDNYTRNFYGPDPNGFFDTFTEPVPWNAHGVAGSIIDITSSTISVRDHEENERSIVIFPGTVIQRLAQRIDWRDLSDGEQITAIGEPTPEGQLDARFIRVLIVPSSSFK